VTDETTTMRRMNPLAWIAPVVIVLVAAGYLVFRFLAAGEVATVDTSLAKRTLNAKYNVALQPLDGTPSVGNIEDFSLTVKSPQGMPVDDAQFMVGGEMPQHGHGLPTSPEIQKGTAPGEYIVHGVKFSMAGYWQLIVNIDSAEIGKDTVTFNLML
jgi:hypothetical protein